MNKNERNGKRKKIYQKERARQAARGARRSEGGAGR